MTYVDLQIALKVMGVGERATIQEIKARHRLLAKQHHPDTSNNGESESIREVNSAYRTLLEYVSAYRFSFSEEEFYEQTPEERLRRQFMNDPHWGKG